MPRPKPKCYLCDEEFESEEQLREHWQAIHSDAMTWENYKALLREIASRQRAARKALSMNNDDEEDNEDEAFDVSSLPQPISMNGPMHYRTPEPPQAPSARFTPARSTRTRHAQTAQAQQSSSIEDRISRLEKMMEMVVQMLGGNSAEDLMKPVVVGEIPVSEIEYDRDRFTISVRVPLEVAYYYNVFKAYVEERGKKWNGDIGDFILASVRMTLESLGIVPAVLRATRGKLILKVPVGGEGYAEEE